MLNVMKWKKIIRNVDIYMPEKMQCLLPNKVKNKIMITDARAKKYGTMQAIIIIDRDL